MVFNQNRDLDGGQALSHRTSVDRSQKKKASLAKAAFAPPKISESSETKDPSARGGHSRQQQLDDHVLMPSLLSPKHMEMSFMSPRPQANRN